eukprot:UN11343
MWIVNINESISSRFIAAFLVGLFEMKFYSYD